MKNKRLLYIGILVLVVGFVLWIPVPVGNSLFRYPGHTEIAELAVAIALNYGPGAGEDASVIALFICSPGLIIVGVGLLITYFVRKKRQQSNKS